MHGIKYRSDIDGLRTLAVVPVILFHLGLPLFSGGFVGVDVFFVISGFLITSAIRREIEDGTFTIVGFYERRARRILPALMVMMLFCAVVGWFLFAPENYKRLGSSMAAAALFFSNILFWMKTNYFSGPVELEPLVHTWSLAVEEQYYILFPLFLVLIARRFSRSYLLPTAGIAILSFAASVAMTYVAPSAGYYLLFSRAWELLIGSLLALDAVPHIHRRLYTEVAAGTGIVMVLVGVFLLSGADRFPGINALWPTVGAALVLHAGSSRHGTLVARVLGTRPFVGIGLISYSLYLWHWPLIVFARYWKMDVLSGMDILAILVATFVLATLSWRFVERPFRNRHKITRKPLFVASAAALAAMTVSGSAIYGMDGIKMRFAGLKLAPLIRADQPLPDEANCFIEESSARTSVWQGDSCILSRGTGGTVLLWGDSHAYQYRHVVADTIGPARHETVILYTAAGCTPIFGAVIPSRPLCAGATARVPEIIRRYHVTRVVLSASWQQKMAENNIPLSALAATIARLRGMGLEVKLLGDNPDFDFDDVRYIGYRLALRGQLDRPYLVKPRSDDSFNGRLRALIGARDFGDPRRILCPDGIRCLVYEGTVPVMGDGGHLTDAGTRLVAPVLAPLFD